MAKNTNTRYTYITFAEEVKGLIAGTVQLTPEIATRVTEKANDLIATQSAKKDYNANNPKKSTAKGASEETKAKADLISSVLPNSADTAMTASELNETLETEFTALQVANAVKFIEGATATKVIRETVNGKGLKQQKEYTAYFRA